MIDDHRVVYRVEAICRVLPIAHSIAANVDGVLCLAAAFERLR